MTQATFFFNTYALLFAVAIFWIPTSPFIGKTMSFGQCHIFGYLVASAIVLISWIMP